MGAGDGHEGRDTEEAGLPNITGNVSVAAAPGGAWFTVAYAEGAFSRASYSDSSAAITSSVAGGYVTALFDASKSSQVYGRATTVQPPAYYVYIWRRAS